MDVNRKIQQLNYQRKENNFLLEQDDFSFEGSRNDPWGFWTIKGKKGKQKLSFDSQYTSAEDALKAVQRRILDLETTPSSA